MKYLYYTIHNFYTKKIKIQRLNDSPGFFCEMGISILETMFLFSLIDYYLILNFSGEYIDYSKWIPLMTIAALYGINHYYFKNRKEKLLEKILKKSNSTKRVINSISSLIILLTIFLFFHTGYLIRTNNGF